MSCCEVMRFLCCVMRWLGVTASGGNKAFIFRVAAYSIACLKQPVIGQGFNTFSTFCVNRRFISVCHDCLSLGHVFSQRDMTYCLLLSLSLVVTLSHFNPLNAELNPICHLLALLGAHHILHIRRMRVKGLRYYHRLALHLSAQTETSVMPYHVPIILCSLPIAPYYKFLLFLKNLQK